MCFFPALKFIDPETPKSIKSKLRRFFKLFPKSAKFVQGLCRGERT